MFVSRTHRPALIPRIYTWYLLLLGAESTAGPYGGPEGLSHLKIRMSPSKIQPANFWLAAQCFNKLRLGVYPNPFTPILISSSYILFGLLGRNFPSVFLTKFLYAFFLPLRCNLPLLSHPVWFHQHKKKIVSYETLKFLITQLLPSGRKDFISTLFWNSSAYVLPWICLSHVRGRQIYLFCTS